MRKRNVKLIVTNIVVFVALFIAGFIVNLPRRTSAITIDGLDFVSVNNYAYDVRGKINGSNTYNFQTTYANAGYSIDFEVDGTNKTIKNATNGLTATNNNVTLTLTEEQTANGVDVKLHLTGNDNAAHSYRVAITADIQLGSNDYAAIYKRDHDGLVITQDNPNKASDYGAKVYIDFYPSVSTSWIGFYNNRQNNKFNESSTSAYTVADNIDTGAAWSWQNTLPASGSLDLISSYNLVETESSAIKFYDKNGNLVEEKTALVGGSVTLPNLTDAEDGYIHSWCDTAEGTGTCYNGNQTIIVENAEVHFYEVDSPKPYSISYDANGGVLSPDNPTVYYVNSDLTLTNPTRTGYTFTGWTGSNGNTPETTVRLQNATGNKMYTANWSINQYTITYDADNGAAPTTFTADYGSTVDLPTPEKTGHTFAGWYTDAGLANQYTATTLGAGDLTLHAKWSVNQYTISFNLDGGTGTAETVTANYGTTIPAPAIPEKTGHTFLGWYFNGIKVTLDGPITVPATNAVFTAKWQVNQYTVTYDAENGEGPTTITADYGTIIATPAAPEKTGHTFLGWYLNDRKLDESGFAIPATDVNIVAKWQTNQYTIYYHANGGTAALDSHTAEYATPVSAPADPTRTGYSFKGWYDANGPYLFTTMPAHDVELMASWQVNQYTLSFDSGNGEDATTITADYGTTITLPIPEKTGHTFLGWLTEDGEPYTSVTMGADNLRLHAAWQVNQYTVSFDLGDGNILNFIVDYGSTITVPDAPTREHFSFDGWYINNLKVNPATFTVPATDVIITARWTHVPLASDTGRGGSAEYDHTPVVFSLPQVGGGNYSYSYVVDSSTPHSDSRNVDNSSLGTITPDPMSPLGVRDNSASTSAADGASRGFFKSALEVLKAIFPFLNLALFFFLLFIIIKRRKEDEEEREANKK